VKTSGNFVHQTILGPALTGLAIAPPQNFAAPDVGSSQEYLGVTFGGGVEYALSNNWSIAGEYRATDFGRRNVILATAPAAGPILPATPVDTTVRLLSQQATLRLNYRFGGPDMATRSVAMAPPSSTNWTGCYAGGYAGAAWSRGSVDTFDPSTNQPVFGPPPFIQSPFYSGGSGLSATPAPYSYNFNASGMAGGTLGCNWQMASSNFVFGVEGEAGVMRLRSSSDLNPYTASSGFTDFTDSTKIGDWYGAVAGRLGYAVNDVLFYLKGGVGFTQVQTASLDTCITGANCNSQILLARGSANPTFGVIGGGAEWAFARNWSVKGEYLYLGLDANVPSCGPGGGRLFVPNLTFCANHLLDGIHTAKLGVNYKFF